MSLQSENPLVSFIIPCYNQGELIIESVESVLHQRYRPVEVFVINDGSNDHQTLTALNKLPSDVHLIHIENSGPSIARNIAVQRCNGKYIVPLDGDDLVLPHTLSKAIPILEKNDSVAVVYGNNQLFGEINELKKQEHFNARNIFLYNPIAFCSIVRKKAYIEVGGLDEWMSKKGLEDWEFWIRLYEKGWSFFYVDETFFKIRINKSSRTFQVANKHLDELKEYVWKKHAPALAKQYEELFYELKAIRETPDYRLGNMLLRPLRILKKLFYK
ncbi:MAG: glycosyltransferase [Chitinophagales bacterium]|nr:glycosyltransferase [Chitinophagales bacterium]